MYSTYLSGRETAAIEVFVKIIFILASVIDVEVVKTNTHFLKIWNTYLSKGQFCHN